MQIVSRKKHNLETIKNLNVNFGLFLKKLNKNIKVFFNNNQLYIVIPTKHFHEFVEFLHLHTNAKFKLLMDICAIDHFEKRLRFEVIYNLLSIRYNTRLNVVIFLEKSQQVATLTDIFNSAN